MKSISRAIFLLALITVIVLAPKRAAAQSKTTEALHKRYSDAMTLFFYNNTLRMLNQAEDKAFDELIKNIEKMKFLMINKNKDFRVDEYKKIITGYKSEAFEEAMTSRHQGKTFDIYLKEENHKTKGVIVLVNDNDALYVLDIVGSIALDQVTKLYSTLDGSSEIGRKIKAFTGDNENDKDHDGDDKERNDR